METTQSVFEQYADEPLCAMAAEGDRMAEDALVMRYHRLVRICARPYFLAGGDSEDLIQEGMVGLLSAIREFDGGRDASFRTFSEICIRSRLISAIKAAARDKHAPLNNYVSFESPLLDGSSYHFQYGSHRAGQQNPEDVMIDREAFRERMDILQCQLSGFEAKILGLYLNGLSYSEIAAEVQRSAKSVDNAVQRIRRKVARQIHSGEFSKG